jgi:hypothetical protein
LVRSRRPSVLRRQVLQKLDPRAEGGAHRRDAEMRAEHVVEMLLLGAKVLALSGNAEPEKIAVETQARLRVTDDDGRMIDSTHGGVPFRRALAWRELQDLEIVSIRVAEIERPDIGGAGRSSRAKVSRTNAEGLRSVFAIVMSFS